MLIGLTGSARAGKDTVAQILAKLDGYQRVAFADPIKRMTETLLAMSPVVLEQMKDHKLAFLKGVTPRRIMQTLGTEWGRNILMDDLWLRFASEKIAVLQEMHYENIVVTDVRFDNEAELIHNLGGVIYKVTRESAETVEAHTSEVGISTQLIDGEIQNTGNLDDLRIEVADMLKQQEW